MSQEYVGAIAIVAYSLLKAFGIELENGVLEGVLTGIVAIWIAFRRHKKGDITVVGTRK